jgi:hypothetical protein
MLHIVEVKIWSVENVIRNTALYILIQIMY